MRIPELQSGACQRHRSELLARCDQDPRIQVVCGGVKQHSVGGRIVGPNQLIVGVDEMQHLAARTLRPDRTLDSRVAFLALRAARALRADDVRLDSGFVPFARFRGGDEP